MLLYCVDLILNTKFNENLMIRNIQNFNSLFVSLFTGFGLLVYYLTSSYYFFPFILKLILFHCSFDLLLTSSIDIFLHHLITVSLSTFFFYKPLPLELLHWETSIVCLTEISSIFLVGREWIPIQSKYYALNNNLFFGSFYYIRLYLLPKYLLLEQSYQHYLITNLTSFEKFWYFTTMYSFMSINIYWGFLILKSLVKKIRNLNSNMFSYRTSEFFLQYTYFLSPFIAISVYQPFGDYHWFDLFGQYLLSINSYNYHKSLYEAINNIPFEVTDYDQQVASIDVISPSIRKYYINDIIAIRIRTFLCITTRLLQKGQLGLIILSVLLTIKLITIYHFYDYVFDLLDDKLEIYYGSNDTIFDHSIRLPILASIGLSIFYSNSMVSANHNFLSLIIISVILWLKPFYELNHLFLHFALIYQSYALCLCNL